MSMKNWYELLMPSSESNLTIPGGRLMSSSPAQWKKNADTALPPFFAAARYSAP